MKNPSWIVQPSWHTSAATCRFVDAALALCRTLRIGYRLTVAHTTSCDRGVTPTPVQGSWPRTAPSAVVAPRCSHGRDPADHGCVLIPETPSRLQVPSKEPPLVPIAYMHHWLIQTGVARTTAEAVRFPLVFHQTLLSAGTRTTGEPIRSAQSIPEA